ncbi:MAG: hypothetical protein NVSMB12_07010 [Acidimicrobiales bacterium]
MNAAVDADLIARSPTRKIKLPEVEMLSRPVLDAADIARLAGAVGLDHAPMVYVGAVLGLRWGEVAGLRVKALDFVGRTLTVAEQRTRGKGGEMITRRPKSAAGRRTMVTASWLMEMLAEHLRRRDLTAVDLEELVFVSPDGEGLDYSHWRQRVWLPALVEAGLVGLQFHDLRRTAATALVAERIDIKTAQTRLGHADPRMTLAVYAQTTSVGDQDAADRVGDRFRPPPTGVVRGTDPGWDLSDSAGSERKVASTSTFVVGKAGFEPAASASRTLRANQAALLPVGP